MSTVAASNVSVNNDAVYYMNRNTVNNDAVNNDAVYPHDVTSTEVTKVNTVAVPNDAVCTTDDAESTEAVNDAVHMI